MKLLKRTGLFNELPTEVKVHRAITLSDLVQSYTLVHDIFVEKGYIHSLENGIRVRINEALPTFATFVACVDSCVVGVQSLAVDDPEIGLPTDAAFKPEIDRLRQDGYLICEAADEAIVEAYRHTSVPTELMRCIFAQAISLKCNQLIATVSPGHAKFYELLGFEQISPVRSYSHELEDPVVVVRMCLDDLGRRVANIRSENGDDEAFLKAYYLDDNPYHRYVGAWSITSEKAFLDPIVLSELFVKRSGMLSGCSYLQLNILRQRWGATIFDKVWRDTSAGCPKDLLS
jgi:hypothetical protein